MIFNPTAECMPVPERKELQLKKLRETVSRAYKNCGFYKNKMDRAGVRPEDIRTLDDISRLPFTTKDELRETYPYGLLSVPLSEIREVHTSSGTTGIPVVGLYTEHDLRMWGESAARCLAMTGATKDDIIQNGYGYGLFTGGLGIHHGGRTLGATVIPISAGNTPRHLQMLRDFKTTTLTCTPSYALYLAEAAQEAGVDLTETALCRGLFGAEPWSENMRIQIEKRLGIKAYDIYGLTEIIGPGVACECTEQHGLHIQDDFFYPEIIDPKTGKALPEGEKGELVLTTIDKTGAPLLRYRTKDITYLFRDACACGRTTVKIHRLMGRNDDMLIIRGVNVFPSQIEEILAATEGLQPHYQIIVDRTGNHLDSIELRVEVDEASFSDETKEMEALRRRLQETIKSKLGINAKITLMEPKSIERSTGKSQRIIDKRKI